MVLNLPASLPSRVDTDKREQSDLSNLQRDPISLAAGGFQQEKLHLFDFENNYLVKIKNPERL